MATWIGNNVTVGGRGSRIRIETQFAGNSQSGNYSVINYQVYYDFFGNDAQLDGGWVQSSAGVHYNNGGRVYNYAGNFSNHTVTMNTGSFAIGHDGNGNASYGMNAHVSVYQSGVSTASGSEGLPNIPRWADLDGYNIDWVRDDALRFAWHFNRGVDYISWWSGAYDGGGHHDEYVGNSQGWFIKELYNIPSDKTYDITVAGRYINSGNWTVSGTAYPTTLRQANMMDIGDF